MRELKGVSRLKKWHFAVAMFLAAAICAAMLLCGCSGSETASDSSNASSDGEYVMQIPISTSLCSAPVALAAEKGYFDQVGLNWEEVSLGDNSSLDYVASGKADVSYDLLQTLVQRISNGLDYSVAVGVHYGCINIVASTESGITSVADLKGKTIGCPTSLGSDPSVMLQRVLTDAGIGCTTDNMEVNMQVFTNADLETALLNGQIDAFVSWDPYASLVAKTYNYPIIWSQSESDMTKDEYCCFVGFRNEFVQEHADYAAKYCEALQMACDDINEDPEAVVQLLIDADRVALDDVELGAQLLTNYRYGLSVDGGRDSFAYCTQSLLDLGIISLNQSVDEFTDQYYVEVDGIDY